MQKKTRNCFFLQSGVISKRHPQLFILESVFEGNLVAKNSSDVDPSSMQEEMLEVNGEVTTTTMMMAMTREEMVE